MAELTEEVPKQEKEELTQEGKTKLFKDTMKRNWDEVIETYKKNPAARAAKITISEETALHVAVSDGKTEVAVQLISAVDAAVLDIVNKAGNTPLHLAAALGNVEVCEHIVSKNGESAATRNKNGETPIFLAALNGKKKSFIFLHAIDPDEKQLRRVNGDTILHVTVAGEYFKLAIRIIKHYPQFVNLKNENGLTPLHILASKTNSFRSSTSLGLYDRLLYYCLDIDELEEPQVNLEAYRKTTTGKKDQTNQRYPENYETCMNFFGLLKLIINGAKQDGKSSADEENPQRQVKDRNEMKTKEGSDNDPLKPQVSVFSQGLKMKKRQGDERRRFFPPNYDIFEQIFKFMIKALFIILGVGFSRIKDIKRKKKLHMEAKLVMDELVTHTDHYMHNGSTGLKPTYEDIPVSMITESFDRQIIKSGPSDQQENGQLIGTGQSKSGKHQTPILIAAKTGVTEIVGRILEEYPVAIYDVDSDGKNVVLLAVENRQLLVYNLLLNSREVLKENVFRQVDENGNSALHLAAQLGEHKPWLIPGSALQMQSEIKWYQFVKTSMPPRFFPEYNNYLETPVELLIRTHETIIKDANDSVSKTSESCSVVAVLVASVAFATASTVPGGTKQESGAPTFEDKPPFIAFAISSLIAFCSSVVALVIFISILASRHNWKNFAVRLPQKLFVAYTALFISIVSMLVSYFGGHTFVLKDELRNVSYALYGILWIPFAWLTISMTPHYIELIYGTCRKAPISRMYNSGDD